MPIRISRASATTVKFSTPQEIIIDHANDSIKLGDGTTLVGVTASNELKTFIGNTATNPLPTIAPKCASTTPTSVSASTSNTTVASANTSRIGLLLFNDSNKACFVKYGATASASDFSFKLESQELAIISQELLYTGRIDAIWLAGATGSMKVTECS